MQKTLFGEQRLHRNTKRASYPKTLATCDVAYVCRKISVSIKTMTVLVDGFQCMIISKEMNTEITQATKDTLVGSAAKRVKTVFLRGP